MSSTHVCLSVIISLYYCYFLSAKIPKGIPRLISLLPIFYLFTILPLYFSSAFLIALTTFFITWLANFKLLLFAFNQGPLSLSTKNATKKLSLPIFISMAALPLRSKQHNLKSNEPNPTKKIPLNLAAEFVLLAIFLELTFHHKSQIHPNLVLICYCFMVFLMIDILVALSSSIAKILVGLELEPPSNEPYLSTSLQDFWGKRWNLTVTNTLRLTVYNPVRSALSEVIGKNWALRVAVLATFVVSGLMHELIFYYVNGVSPSWEMTLFFVLHGLCVMVEIGVKRAVKDTWRLPWFVSGPLTVGFVVATAFGLFFPPIIRNGADERVLEEVGTCYDFIKTKMLQLPNFVGHFR
ncbi:putative long-chain-alcohol O-fatty-acyltransferase 5 [Nicotiana tabacum]|uniref:Long-chain-alcohol O-fatty-acyltransferase 5 n=1 Tax=Nicotiana tabacum TaxID=4097 RepID=A0A1S4D7P4_TOBAC|nr:PREDICTED: probable long-chain-alcohol O-fatty-acyltransferase 5 [Nicotiana tabacum]XP_033509965.1 probable long-chain-alcohol O-fatty-acyltransferase 5 [Nicotiana tomentosiformis]